MYQFSWEKIVFDKNVNVVKTDFFSKLAIPLWHLQAAVLHTLFSSRIRLLDYTSHDACCWNSKSSGKLAKKGSACLFDEFSLYNSVSLYTKIGAAATPLGYSIRHG